MARGKNIHLFLMDGDANGRIKCTLDFWTGVVYKIPRTEIAKCSEIDHLKQCGVYFLFGTDNDDNPAVYVGQARVRKNGEGILLRIQEPHNSVDYWTDAVIFTTTDKSFGPTEISYLENSFCNLAIKAKRYSVKNGNDPSPGNLTEEKVCGLEEFIDYAKIILKALGYPVLTQLPVSSGNTQDNDSTPELYFSRNSFNASGKQVSEGFVVFKGSVINKSIAPSCSDRAKKLREEYKDKIDENMTLKETLLFSSPSSASDFVSGYSTSGKTSWKTKDGKTLRDLESSEEIMQ